MYRPKIKELFLGSHEMKDISATSSTSLCPSAQPGMRDSCVFGIVGGTAEEPRLDYLAEPQRITDELLALAHPVQPTEIFRFAAPCAGSTCHHFDGSNCRLVTRIVQLLPTVVEKIPPCSLRSKCRWWQQEGKEACKRCPQVVTITYNPSEQLLQVANPSSL